MGSPAAQLAAQHAASKESMLERAGELLEVAAGEQAVVAAARPSRWQVEVEVEE